MLVYKQLDYLILWYVLQLPYPKNIRRRYESILKVIIFMRKKLIF